MHRYVIFRSAEVDVWPYYYYFFLLLHINYAHIKVSLKSGQ
jgi:hypothetical protein